MLHLRTLGVPSLQHEQEPVDGLPLGKPFAVLCYVALSARPVDRAELASLLWPDAPSDRARASVRQAIWLLKKHLGDDFFESTDPVEIQAGRLTHDVEMLRRSLSQGDLGSATLLRRGGFLTGLGVSAARPFEIWAEEIRDELDQAFVRALGDASEESLVAGRFEEAEQLATSMLSVDQHQIRGHRVRVSALTRSGRLEQAREALYEAETWVGTIPGESDTLGKLRHDVESAADSMHSERPDGFGFHVDFVGRAPELALLRERSGRVLSGSSATIGVHGPSGIGKSRLALEGAAGLTGAGGNLAVVRCYEAESQLAWGVTSELILMLSRLPGAAGVTATTDSVLAGLSPARGAGHKARDPGRSYEPSAYAEAVLDLVTAIAFEGPLVLVIDDLQWCDPESKGLLARVLRRLEQHPVMVMLTARFSSTTAGVLPEDADSVELAPLSPPEIEEMVAMSVRIEPHGSEASVTSALASASGGNPLFVGESLKDLRDRGAIEHDGDGWVLDANAVSQPMPIPVSVQELLRRRLDRLEPSESVIVRTLARHSGAARLEELRSGSGLSDELFRRSLEELIDRGVVHRPELASVDFTHPTLRESMSELRGVPRAPKPTHAIALAIAVLAVVVATAFVMRPGATTAPFGEGVLVMTTGDAFVGLRPPGPGGGTWTTELLDRPWTPEITRFRRTASGDVVWFGGRRDDEHGPGAVEYLNGDTVASAVFDVPGLDDNYVDVSPDGALALIRRQDPEPEGFAMMDIAIPRSGGGDRFLLRNGTWPGTLSNWSPDGRTLLYAPDRVGDSLMVLSGEGEHLSTLGSLELDVMSHVVWCPDSRNVVVSLRTGPAIVPYLVSVESGTSTLVSPEIEYGFPRACIGSSNAIVFEGMVNGAPTVGVFDPSSGSIVDLSSTVESAGAGREVRVLGWLPDASPIVPTRLGLDRSMVAVDWGGTDSVRAETMWSDGSQSLVEIRWSSREPAIASVAPDGAITGNRPGETWVLASLPSGPRDSTLVRVTGDMGRGPLFDDLFDSPSLGWWSDFGTPAATIREVGGRLVLAHNGDGLYADQLQTVEGFALPSGGTMEVEFQLPVTRIDRQRALLCLHPDRRPRTSDRVLPQNGICFEYPSGEGLNQRTDMADIGPRVIPTRLRESVPGSFDTNGWTHMAIQILADGTVEIWLDREHWFTSPWPIEMDPALYWRPVIAGAAFETEYLVRRVTLWEGARLQHGSGEQNVVVGQDEGEF